MTNTRSSPGANGVQVSLVVSGVVTTTATRSCGVVAWVLVWLARRANAPEHTSVLFGRRVVDGFFDESLYLMDAYFGGAIAITALLALGFILFMLSFAVLAASRLLLRPPAGQ